ncbi:transcriptional regulatory protein [Rhizoctonia solani]|uniref:Transcriptional regulatory protein n=1 Tax=Rhizoctonia solani TaxID=456999 RepID=A0A8H8PBM9_9AGAM|nr:transcriptional regulatory protein [Rhizoctonia solani]QRW26957.1 transcriptional regulatory protein [Rhizoctonia solani]
MLFERTKLEVEANIARAYEGDRGTYNPLYHLQAMIMLGQWFYLKGRLLEGYVYVTRATRACFIRDFCGSAMNGLPTSLSLGEIKTVWPVALSEFENSHESGLPNDSHSVASLFDSRYCHIVADVSQASASCILAKCTVLTYCAGVIDTERISGSEVSDEWQRRFKECDRGIEYFTQSIQTVYVGRDDQEVAAVVVSQAAVDCAIIQLHEPLVDRELNRDGQGVRSSSLGGSSYSRCIEACRRIALAAACVEKIEANHMQMFFGISLSFAARVLAKEIPRLRHGGYVEQALRMEQQMAAIAKGMERMFAVYPVLVLFVEHLRSL